MPVHKNLLHSYHNHSAIVYTFFKVHAKNILAATAKLKNKLHHDKSGSHVHSV